MRKNKKVKILLLVMIVAFSVTFYFGIFANPNFNLNDFCLNLSSEVLGLLITVAIVDSYIREKTK